MKNNTAHSLPNSQNIHRYTLANGVVVLVYENFAAQSVVARGSFRAGGLYETPEKNGLAALTAEALMRGTETRDFNQIAGALEDIGADAGFGAGNHRTSFFGKSLAEDLDTVLDVVADCIRRPIFPEHQIERLRGEWITGLQIAMQSTRYRANRAFHETLYPENHPYHYSGRGSVETIGNVTVSDISDFRRKVYGPEGMIISIAGAVKAEDALEIVRRHFDDWQNPDQPPAPALPEIPALDATRRSSVTLSGKTQSDVVLGAVGPSRFAPDYLAAMLANSILGQFGMMGRIGASVRERLGLAYYAYSQLDGGLGPTPWTVAAGVNPANLELAIERSIDELRRLGDEKVSAEDLADNQAYVVGRLPLQLESNEGIAGTMLSMETYALGLDYLVEFPDQINRLTEEDLRAAASKYLTTDRLVIGIAGPALN